MHTNGSVQLSVPVAPWTPEMGYFSRRVDVHLTPEQEAMLRRMTAALRNKHAKLASGKEILSGGDTVRKVLETLYEIETSKPPPKRGPGRPRKHPVS